MKTPTLRSIALAIFLLPALAIAQDDADSDAKIKEITEAHEEKMKAFSKKMRALPREEQRKLYQTEYPNSEEAVGQLTEIVKANPESDSSLDAISWILRNSRTGVDASVFGALEEHHLNNDKLEDIIGGLMRGASPEADKFLQTVSEKSEKKDLRGMAIYSRAVGMERDPDKSDEYTTLLEKIVADHQDLKIGSRKTKVAKRAEGKLFAAKNLSIGKEAPEIVGKDVDGNEMKLSDHRGKVVVIDFWGDW